MFRPDNATLTLGRQDLIVGFTSYRHSKNPGGGTRDKITELSYQSRLRMMRSIRNQPIYPNMLTLTYPGQWSTDGVEVKYHWQKMRQWLQRQGCDVGFWFLEFQKRGAPHFHIFLPIDVDYKAVAARWFAIVGSDDERHLRAGTRIEAMRNKDGAAAYAAKYAMKCEQKDVPPDYQNVGRFWGTWGNPTQWAESNNFTVSQVLAVSRTARRWTKSLNRSSKRVTCEKTGRLIWQKYVPIPLYNEDGSRQVVEKNGELVPVSKVRKPRSVANGSSGYGHYMYGAATPILWAMAHGKFDKLLDIPNTEPLPLNRQPGRRKRLLELTHLIQNPQNRIRKTCQTILHSTSLRLQKAHPLNVGMGR